MCEGAKERGREAGKTASLGGLPLKFMIVLNICRPLQHSPGGSLFAFLVGFDARARKLQLTQQKCLCACTHVGACCTGSHCS